MKNIITLAMIVRNEAENLQKCLESVSGQVDGIVIVDTGSTDDTLDVARKYTDKIYNFIWSDDFSAARNFAIERAGGNWILSLDADESLVAGTGDLKVLVNEAEHEAYMLPLDIPSGDGSGRYNRALALRLFKNQERYRYRGKIHEAVHDSGNGLVGVAGGPVIMHKMVSPREVNRKKGRNLTLLKKVCAEDPEDNFLQYCLGAEWMSMGKPGLALPYLRRAYKNSAGDSSVYRTAALICLIDCLTVQRSLDEAMYVCQEAMDSYPGYADLFYHCGQLYMEEKAFSPALEWFGRAVKCGLPPALYNHRDGTESFLALHGMGYCHEMIGCPDQALKAYRQALDCNPYYANPAGSLFMLLYAGRGPGQALQYFMEEGLLGNRSIALTAANLFFNGGYPGLARRCLEIYLNGGESDEKLLFNLGKYSTLSGKPGDGINFLSQVPEECDFYPDAQLYGTIALLLACRYEEARGRALEMWKKRDKCAAFLALKLGRFMEKGGDLRCPGTVAGADTASAAMKLYGECCLYLPDGPDYESQRAFKLLEGLEVVLKGSSRGFLSLIEYYRGKYQQGDQLFNYKMNLGQKIRAF